MSGIDLVTLASMLEHSRIQMVLRYAHPTQDHQTKAMERLEQFNACNRSENLSGKREKRSEEVSTLNGWFLFDVASPSVWVFNSLPLRIPAAVQE